MATMASETVLMGTVPNDRDAWRAVEHRDVRYDGRFVYAVRSTGVYCRPSCPSRRPSRANVLFFEAPAAAEDAGYRACLRCAPHRPHAAGSASALGRARAFLDAHAGDHVSLAALARHASLSPTYLQRAFKRAFGVSPKEYQDALRAERFKTRLRAGDTVSRATFEAGYGSSSRVYERAHERLGMTPAAFRRGGAGMRIVYAIAESSLGLVLVGHTDRGVCAVALGASDAELERGLRADFPKATIERATSATHAWVQAVLDRIRDPRAGHPVPLDVNGTAFQWRVWKALQEIPAGANRSYREVARSIGRPSAARAVARACASNRLAVVIPCHRVVREDGGLGGYRWGLERKRSLLDQEIET
jgi:AraC family transcriptional regulator, regulatory protein of adaptative response / methylated-DNA-[protein]-cysteine methyltransferase